MPGNTSRLAKRKFKTANRVTVPTGRKGKHNGVVTQILSDLDGLDSDQCLKIPLDELPDTKANVRSALNRATRKHNKAVATAADEEFLYVWNA
jgi:hypothetical protein